MNKRTEAETNTQCCSHPESTLPKESSLSLVEFYGSAHHVYAFQRISVPTMSSYHKVKR